MDGMSRGKPHPTSSPLDISHCIGENEAKAIILTMRREQ
jgi:hypothetical protein